MTAFCGWLGPPEGDAELRSRLQRMTGAMPMHRSFVTAVEQLPGGTIARTDRAPACSVYRDGSTLAAIVGAPRWSDHLLRDEAAAMGHACAFARHVRTHGAAALEDLHDTFAAAYVDAATQTALLATDRLGTIALYHASRDRRLVFGTHLSAVIRALDAAPGPDLQALYHFLTFSFVPSPFSGFEGVRALGPAEYLWHERGAPGQATYWRPHFHESGPRASATHAELREVIAASVARDASSERPAAFLSGGIDSTTIVALMSRVRGEPVAAYSLGHDGGDANELPYASLAARTFGAVHHQCVLTPPLLLEAMRATASFSGAPCGNVSAPALLTLTQRAAADGVTLMLGGDGGDELFAGNESYRLQKLLARWDRIPAAVRHAMLEPAIRAIPDSFPLARRAKGYVRRASLPLPERLLNWTPMFESGASRVLSDDFLSAVDRGGPVALLRNTYDQVDARTPLARNLATDWRFILHGNDLPRVRGACTMAGLDLALPMLGDDVVELSTRIPARERMTGELRTFYKNAFRDLLPPEILRKKKQGEGIPLERWMKCDGVLRDFMGDTLTAFRRRGIARASALDQSLGRPVFSDGELPAALLYHMTMLELWFACHVDRGAAPLSPPSERSGHTA